MNSLHRGGALILVLLLSNCALPRQNAYDEWRDFYLQMETMNTAERNAQALKLRTRHEQSPSAITRLQLAYLTLLSPSSDGGAYSAKRTAALLEGIEDDHELAPLRDLLSRSIQLRESQANVTAELKELRAECVLVVDSREKLRAEREALEYEVVSCADQVEALKEIENVMSAPDSSPAMLP